jgi:hypothetical protein
VDEYARRRVLEIMENVKPFNNRRRWLRSPIRAGKVLAAPHEWVARSTVCRKSGMVYASQK